MLYVSAAGVNKIYARSLLRIFIAYKNSFLSNRGASRVLIGRANSQSQPLCNEMRCLSLRVNFLYYLFSTSFSLHDLIIRLFYFRCKKYNMTQLQRTDLR